MRHLALMMLLLDPRSLLEQGGPSDPVAAAMAAVNVVLPAEAEIALALSGAPEHLRGEATVYVYGRRGYERVRTDPGVRHDNLQREEGGAVLAPSCRSEVEPRATVRARGRRVSALPLLTYGVEHPDRTELAQSPF